MQETQEKIYIMQHWILNSSCNSCFPKMYHFFFLPLFFPLRSLRLCGEKSIFIRSKLIFGDGDAVHRARADAVTASDAFIIIYSNCLYFTPVFGLYIIQITVFCNLNIFCHLDTIHWHNINAGQAVDAAADIYLVIIMAEITPFRFSNRFLF